MRIASMLERLVLIAAMAGAAPAHPRLDDPPPAASPSEVAAIAELYRRAEAGERLSEEESMRLTMAMADETFVPPATLAPRPDVTLDSTRVHPTPEEQAEIHQLIEGLVQVSSPDRGFAPWMSGSAFAPLSQLATFDSGILGNHGLRTDPRIVRLVELGPKAIPALLAALDDPAPAEVAPLVHEGGIGGMWHGAEFDFNRANEREAAAVAAVEGLNPRDSFGRERDVDRHTVTRGDLCFVILGQIVNRGYQAVRYQPTACRVVNSPTATPALATAARAIWASDEPSAMLFESLLTDFRTRGHGSEQFQAGAATRLAFYFPQETAAMLAARLDGLDVSPVPKGTDENDWTPHRIRAKANGIDPAALVEALSWSTRPEVTRAIAAIGLRADDASVLQASISPATREIAGEAMFARLAKLVEEATPTNYGSGEHYRVDTIGTLVRNWPQRAQAPIERFLAPGGIPRMQAVAYGLGGAEELPAWCKPLLTRWLEDTTVLREANASEPGSPELLFCDLVAETIARRLGVPFHWTETRKRRDAARAAISAALNGTAPPPAPLAAPPVPRMEPLATIGVPAGVHGFWPNSTRERLLGIAGRRGHTLCWGLDTVIIDAGSGAVLETVPLEEWNGAVSVIRPPSGSTALCYHGDRVSARDVATGKPIAEYQTPFQDDSHFGEDNSRWVRNLQDLAVSADGRWLVASTPDGAVHTVHLPTGTATLPWRFEAREGFSDGWPIEGAVIPIRGGNSFLVAPDFSADRRPAIVLDAPSGAVTPLERVPATGWRSAWETSSGPVAWNAVNGWLKLWNLRTQERLELDPEPAQGVVDLLVDGRSTLCVLRADEIVEVWRLAPEPTRLAELAAVNANPTEGAEESARPAAGAAHRGTIELIDEGRTLVHIVPPPRDPETGEPLAGSHAKVHLYDLARWR